MPGLLGMEQEERARGARGLRGLQGYLPTGRAAKMGQALLR